MLPVFRTSFVSFASCVLLVACGGDRQADAYRDAPQLLLTPSVQYCQFNPGDHCEFLTMTPVAAGPDGGVILGEPAGPIVRFGPQGAYLGTIGRRGGGEGEFQFVVAAEFASGGGVVLHDFGAGRRLRYDSTGAFITAVPESTDFGVRSIVSGPLGVGVLRTLPGSGLDSLEAEFVLRRDTSTARVVARMRVAALPEGAGDGSDVPFFADAPHWVVESDTSVLVASGPTLRIERITSSGARSTFVDVPTLGERRVTESDVATELTVRRQQVNARVPEPGAAAARERLEASARAAATVHPFTAALVRLYDGSLWLREAERRAGGAARWTRFDADGVPTAFVLLPGDAELLGGDATRVLVRQPDNAGLPVASWFLLTPAESSG